MISLKGIKIDGNSLLLGSALGACGGSVLGWFIARRKMEAEIAREVAGVKQYYADKTAADAAGEGDHPDAARIIAAVGAGEDRPHVITTVESVSIGLHTGKQPLAEAAERLLPPSGDPMEGLPDDSGSGDEEDDDDPGEITKSLLRDTTVPYVISSDEFFADELDFTKVSLTWYAEDSVLVDERDTPLRDHSICGPDFMHKFGVDSQDDHMVYIRNEPLSIDIEVVLKEGSFAKDVLGYGQPT